MKNLLLYKKIFVFSIAIFFVNIVLCQQGLVLFDSTTRSEIGFDSLQSDKLDSMTANPIYLSHFFVEVNELYDIQDSGSIYVNLPDKSVIVRFDGINIEYLNNGDYTFYGELDTCDELRGGYIHLLSKNGNLFGQLNIEDEIYELQDYGNHKNVLFKFDPSIVSAFKCGNDTISSYKDELMLQSRSNPICNVRVLFLYTDRASLVGNSMNSAKLFLKQTNQIARNSEVDFYFSLAGVQRIVDFKEELDTETTLKNITEDDDAKYYRGYYQADIVVLLTDGNWYGPGTQEVGLANLNFWKDPGYAYVLVEIDAGGAIYTCSHEIAHVFGCKHQDDDRGAPEFEFKARGYNFKTGWWPFKRDRNTVVNTESNTIMHFSNPDVKYKNNATGVEDERDNVYQLNAMGCTVSEYEDYTEPLNVNISGPSKGNNSGNYTWCANITGCPNPLSIVWEYSLDGFNYYTWPSNGGNCITGNLPIGQSIWFRVTVDCGGGQIATDWHRTVNISQLNPCYSGSTELIKKSIDEVNAIEISENLLNVYPNPTSGEIIIKFFVDEITDVNIKLLDLSGREVAELSTGVRSTGAHFESYNIANYSHGYYVLIAIIGNKSITKSIIKQ